MYTRRYKGTMNSHFNSESVPVGYVPKAFLALIAELAAARLPESNLELVPEPCPWWRVASTAATTGGTRNEDETDGEGKTDGTGETDGEGEMDGEGKTDGEGEKDGEGETDGEGERDGQPPEGQSRRGRGRDTRGRDAVARGMREMRRDLKEFENSNTKKSTVGPKSTVRMSPKPTPQSRHLVRLSVFFFFFSFSPRSPSIATASLTSNVSRKGLSRPRPRLGTLGM